MTWADEALQNEIVNYVRVHPGCTTEEIAAQRDIPMRVVAATIGHLRNMEKIELASVTRERVCTWRIIDDQSGRRY